MVQRVLVTNSNSDHKQDGIVILRCLIVIFETLTGTIEQALPTLVGILLAELKMAFESESPKNYKSMLLQTLAIAIYNSPATVMGIIEQNGQLEAVFQNLIKFMDRGGFQLEFEIKRIIFGLVSLLKFSAQPVHQHLPAIGKNLARLAHRVHKQRLKTLTENEKFIARGFGENENSDDGGENGDDDNSGDEEVKQGSNINSGENDNEAD